MENKKSSDISSEEHTLFVKLVPERKKVLDRKKRTYHVTPKFRHFVVYVEKFREFKKGLHKVLNELRTASMDDVLELRINSSGGFINEGQQFYNLINEKFHKRTIAYIDNHAYSMGAMMFCMTKRRVVYPYSDLMFHNYSGGAFGKGGEIKTKIEHKSKLLEKFMYSVIVEKGFLTPDEFQKMLIGQDFWFDTKAMCERKIATHVIYNGEMIKAKKYLKLLANSSNSSKQKRKKEEVKHSSPRDTKS